VAVWKQHPGTLLMQLRLLPMSVQRIDELLAGSQNIGRLAIVDGALPPNFILEQAASAINRGEPAFWHAPRLFVVEELSMAVGTGGFKGAPSNGGVEIGYNVAESYRGKGYATEAVRLLVREALAQPEVSHVDAETAVDNIASRRVAEKAGFVHVEQRQTASDGLVDRWLFKP
jgi:[ribosomal protein S5]-alanine N-acetyltransferase